MKPMKIEDLAKISPERSRIAQVFKKHVDAALAVLGAGYDVALQESLDKTPIRLVVEVNSSAEIP